MMNNTIARFHSYIVLNGIAFNILSWSAPVDS
jgi:hypothetical protein